MLLKTWFQEKQYNIAKCYQIFIDTYNRRPDDMIDWEAEYQDVCVDKKISETEKAVQVVLRSGMIVGSSKGWKCWIPKSCIKEN